MYLDKDTILNSLTKDDVKKIVMKLGSAEPHEDSHGNMIFQTICHNTPNVNNSYKLYYYHDSSTEYKGKTFHCYSGCQDSFNIVELVIRANRVNGKTITWYKALRWIGQITGKISIIANPEKDSFEQPISDFEWINRLKAVKKNKRSIPTLSEINEEILEIFYYAPHEEWLNDNISREALSRFEIGYYGLTNQITIPHRDKDGRLIGIRGRYLSEDDVKNIGKYVPLQIEGRFLSHRLGCNLYGLHIVKDKILRCKKIMLVEGEKSCLQAYSYFGEDSFVVAVCGSEISMTQIKMLNELGVEEVIVGFDREYHASDSFEAELWWQKMVKKVAPLVPYMKVSIVADSKDRLEFKDSPFDKGKKILLELLEEKISVTMEEVRRVKSMNK